MPCAPLLLLFLALMASVRGQTCGDESYNDYEIPPAVEKEEKPPGDPDPLSVEKALESPNYSHLVFVVDMKYNTIGNDEAVRKFVQELTRKATRIMSQINFHLMVKKIYLMTNDTGMRFGPTKGEHLTNFREWTISNKEMLGLQDWAPHAVFMSERPLTGPISGKTYANSACNLHLQRTQLIMFLERDRTVPDDDKAATLAHELGHNLGAGYHDCDDPRTCICTDMNGKQNSKCLMHHNGAAMEVARFSNCSVANITRYVGSQGDFCTLKDPMRYGQPEVSVCGNNVTELNETCECKAEKMLDGSFDCVFDKFADKCCDIYSCKMLPGPCALPTPSPSSDELSAITMATIGLLCLTGLLITGFAIYLFVEKHREQSSYQKFDANYNVADEEAQLTPSRRPEKHAKSL